MQHLPQMRQSSDFRFADNRFFIPSTSLKELSKQGEYNRFGLAHELASNGEREQRGLHGSENGFKQDERLRRAGERLRLRLLQAHHSEAVRERARELKGLPDLSGPMLLSGKV